VQESGESVYTSDSIATNTEVLCKSFSSFFDSFFLCFENGAWGHGERGSACYEIMELQVD
jgi:hypothetical protein